MRPSPGSGAGRPGRPHSSTLLCFGGGGGIDSVVYVDMSPSPAHTRTVRPRAGPVHQDGGRRGAGGRGPQRRWYRYQPQGVLRQGWRREAGRCAVEHQQGRVVVVEGGPSVGCFVRSACRWRRRRCSRRRRGRGVKRLRRRCSSRRRRRCRCRRHRHLCIYMCVCVFGGGGGGGFRVSRSIEVVSTWVRSRREVARVVRFWRRLAHTYWTTSEPASGST